MIKLIATDIDGTLLADGTLKINPEYYDVIKELRNRGVRVIAQVLRKCLHRSLMK